MRRRGPGLLRMAAGTAVIAGTAGAVQHRQMNKYAAKDQQAAEAAAYEQQQAQAPPPQYDAPPQYAPAPPPPAAAPGDDLVGQLTKLSSLRDAGVLSPEEFDAAKAKLLA